MSNPFFHEKRKVFSPQERAKIFALAGGQCAQCTRKIMAGEDWDLDHRLALELGGDNSIGNMQVLCSWCHVEKTAEDHEQAGHARRSYTKHVVPQRFRKSRAWR